MEWSTDFSRKRHPTDELVEEQPLSKRLSLLHLTNGKLHLASLNGYKKQEKLQSPRKQYVPTEEERMEVDNVVYVDDLDSDSDPDDGSPKVIFLHDIDKQLTRVPYSLCNEPSSSTPSTSTEVILYSVPSSLTVPEQRDSVRRAIIETRARMRQKQVDMEAAAAARSSQVNEATGVADSIAAVPEVDMVDAMEIE